jgi:hypothetical protein
MNVVTAFTTGWRGPATIAGAPQAVCRAVVCGRVAVVVDAVADIGLPRVDEEIVVCAVAVEAVARGARICVEAA